MLLMVAEPQALPTATALDASVSATLSRQRSWVTSNLPASALFDPSSVHFDAFYPVLLRRREDSCPWKWRLPVGCTYGQWHVFGAAK